MSWPFLNALVTAADVVTDVAGQVDVREDGPASRR